MRKRASQETSGLLPVHENREKLGDPGGGSRVFRSEKALTVQTIAAN
jgi:hypothetical protein